MRHSCIVGVGRHLPPRVVTNAELGAMMETTDEWIQQRTGFRERRFSDDRTGGVDMGAEAAQQALQASGLSALMRW